MTVEQYLKQLMRMTATGVVCQISTRPDFSLIISLDHGSAWHAGSCSSSKVSYSVLLFFVTVQFAGRLCPVDAIITRMGAYDNMFSNASTFKVELDEWFDLLCLPLNTGENLSSTVAKFSVTRHPSHLLSSTVQEILLATKKQFLIYINFTSRTW